MAPRPRDVVVVGASAGGVEALRDMVAGLPPDLPACVLVVLHMPTGGTSALPAILNRAGKLPAVAARHGDWLEHGRIYVARPNHHLMVIDGVVGLSHGPSENGHRPAINALFRSAALARGAAVTGVLLSGVLDDGVAGLHAIASRGGRVIVQHPDDALYSGMPEHALQALTADHVLPAADIGAVLAKITAEEAETPDEGAPGLLRWENEIATAGAQVEQVEGAEHVGTPSEFACPDCHGVLSEIGDDRFRCRVGHAWTVEALLAAQGSAFERALWTALRTLREKSALSARMAEAARERGSDRIAERYERLARETNEAANVLRQQLSGRDRTEDDSRDR
jgi:two-component system, chemotaxis family, protein-glutamate methylesterase/glutaminase